ncbi:MAG: phosphatidate cytidylyltransferase [Erysipelotrichaceae bacterium]|jgi:phosphatidate cytidylyltransferase|nr:phosphatidate cytidylyltransferase [Erysipelotrichaceae bacterium]
MNKMTGQINKITPEQQTSMWKRILTAVIAILIIIPSVFLGGWYFFSISILFVAFASWELVRSAKKKYNPLLYIFTFILISFLTYAPLIKNYFSPADGDPYLFTNFNTLYLSVLIVVVAIILTFSLVLIDKNFEVRDAAYIVTFGIVIGLGMQSLLFARFYPLNEYYVDTIPHPANNDFFNYFESTYLLFFIAVGALMCDTGAYFTGLLFGRNKINERISPKKTWEGFAGGAAFSLAFTQSFAFIAAACGTPIIKSLDLDHWYFIVILGLLISVISQLGDFIFSSIKRYYSIKDFGFIMPGHGGILDRIDSVIFASLSSSILIIIFNFAISGNWGGLFL